MTPDAMRSASQAEGHDRSVAVSIKDQVTVRLTAQDKADLQTVMLHDGTLHVSKALRDAVHRNAEVIRRAGKGR